MIIEIQLSELNVGHFVTDIAKQNGTFTLSSPGHIKSINVIHNLKSKHVISVFIDDSKTLIPASKSKAEISAEVKQAV